MSFNIDRQIRNAVIAGSIKPEELAIQRSTSASGTVYEIKKITDLNPSLPLDQVISTASDVALALTKVANGETLPPELQELGKDQSFRVFAKSVPHMESAEHRLKVKTAFQEKVRRVKAILQVAGEGISALKQAGKPYKLVDKPYLLREIAIPGRPISVDTPMLADFWKHSDTTLSYSPWLEATHREWENASPGKKDFLPWLAETSFKKQEITAWTEDHPGESFADDKLTAWKTTQDNFHPIFAEPKWFWTKRWKESCADIPKGETPPTFESWMKDAIAGDISFLNDIAKKSEGMLPFFETDTAFIKAFEQKFFEHAISGSPIDQLVWIAKEFWKETNPPDLSEQTFLDHLEKQQCTFEIKQNKIDTCQKHIDHLKNQRDHCKSGSSGRAKKASLSEQIDHHEKRLLAIIKTPITVKAEDVKQWRVKKDNELLNRWTKSGCALPLAVWKAQQLIDPAKPVSFVRLNAQERKAYQNECVNGCLTRNGAPCSSEEESTMHSGKGWVIFVLGPENDLYSASHLRGLFHHSSFFGDRAVMAAGEIKTDAKGKILEISAKSGHYKPTDKENVAVLKWFQDHGVALKDVAFSYYLSDGNKSEPINANDYFAKNIHLL